MPEGHTLRRLALDLTDALGGCRLDVSSPQGRFVTEAAMLDRSVFLGAESAGKHLFCEFEDDRFVHVHLGLIGGFHVHRHVVEVPPPVGQVRLRLVAVRDASARAYADLRGATRCDLVTPARRDQVVASLGPDPLRDADPVRAWQRIRRSQRPIGQLLMDQEVIAGVGNVFRAEVLFRHRVHPLRPGRTLRVSQFQAVWDDLVGLLAEGVVSGRIDTVHAAYTPPELARRLPADARAGAVYVYRRAGEPCLVCGTRIRTDVLAGRNLFWCPRCQPRFRSRARS